MFDAVVTALLWPVADKVCVDVPTDAAGRKALGASQSLDSTPKSEFDAGNRAVGRPAILPAPSMWN